MARNFPPRYNFPVTTLGRPTCLKCFRPSSYCVCGFVEPFRAHFNTLILQHPHERRKYCSTTKLVHHAIKNSRLVRGIEFDSTDLEELLRGQKAYLLYPSADAVDCADIPLNSTTTVVVVDGTWREARKLIYRNEFLKTLPCLTFQAQLRSEYRIRKQPKDGCLSTLESLGHLLKQNAAVNGHEELIPAYESLFHGFKKMIDQQIAHWPARDTTRERRIQ